MQFFVSRFGELGRRVAVSRRALALAVVLPGCLALPFLSPGAVCAASGDAPGASAQAGSAPPASPPPAREIIRDTPKYDKSLVRKQKAVSAKSAQQEAAKKEPAKKEAARKTQPKAAPPSKAAAGKSAGAAKEKAGPQTPPAATAQAATTAGTAALEKITFPASKVTPISLEKGARLPVADTWMPLLSRLNKDGVDMGWLRAMFGRMGDAYSHEPMGTKVNELFTYKFVPRPPRKAVPAQPSATPSVYKSMVTPQSIEKCKVYLEAHKVAFARMEEQYGVPKEVVAGLLMVETRLGTFLGHNSSFWSLACMAAADSPDRVSPTVEALPLPMTPDKEEWLQQVLRERSAWAYKELLALARHSVANDLDPLCMPGSVYGAIGICQFMPSNLPKFAVDGNKDGKIDLFDPADAIPSVGNYLKEHGWTGKEIGAASRDGHHKALKRYNKSNVYANTILAIAEGVAPPAPTADAGGKAAPQAKQAVKKQNAPKKAAAKASGKKQASGKAARKAPAKPAKANAPKKPAGNAASKSAPATG